MTGVHRDDAAHGLGVERADGQALLRRGEPLDERDELRRGLAAMADQQQAGTAGQPAGALGEAAGGIGGGGVEVVDHDEPGTGCDDGERAASASPRRGAAAGM